MPLHIPFVKPEREFVNVSGKVFWAGVVINPMQTAPKNGEHTLNTIGRYTLAGILTLAVIYAFVRVVFVKPLICSQFVRMER